MRHLYYVVKTLWHNRGTTLIKVVSLGLALTMCTLLFTRIAYMMSYDTSYKDYKALYQYRMKFGVEESDDYQYRMLGPISSIVAEAYPDIIASSTRMFAGNYVPRVFLNDNGIELNGMAAEPTFFTTFGVDVIEGDPSELSQPENIFVSEETARKINPDGSPIGVDVRADNGNTYRIKGVFAPVAVNSSVRPDAIFSINDASRYWNPGANCWTGFVRLKEEIDLDRLDAMVERAVRPAYPRTDSWNLYEVQLRPLYEYVRNTDDVKRMCTIMAVLGTTLLLIASLNYVLLSISSMSRRAKAIGVQKCSGAGPGRIFAMFMQETALILAMALLVAAIVTLNCREFIEEIISTPLSSLFTGARVWITVGVLAAILIIGGAVPARLFARIPVSQVFRRYTERNSPWKRVLLLIEFTGVAFTCGLMSVMSIQYRHIVDNNRNFNPEPVAVAGDWALDSAAYEVVVSTIRNLPYVDDCGGSSYLFFDSFEGNLTESGVETLLSTIDDNVPELLGFNIIHGRPTERAGEALINEKLMNDLHLSPTTALGDKKLLNMQGGHSYTIVGIIGDIDLHSAYSEAPPSLVIHPGSFFYNGIKNILMVKLKAPYSENLLKLNEDVNEAFPAAHAEFIMMADGLKGRYNDIRVFRNAVMVTSIIILFITFMGLLGFIADEIQRRRKEIAIRKVNGAETADVLRLLTGDVVKVALPGVVIGTALAAVTGNTWIQQFADRTPELWLYYILTAIALLAVITGSSIAMTIRSARENPADNLKSE